MRGLVKQHIDSFNYFLNVDMKNIVNANSVITSDNPNFQDFYIKFNDIKVWKPMMFEDYKMCELMPNDCRLRDMTYQAPIMVTIEYTKGNKVQILKDVKIGYMPIMLGSSNCWLTGKNHEWLAKKKECPYDPRGYFIIKGSEKCVLIQE